MIFCGWREVENGASGRYCGFKTVSMMIVEEGEICGLFVFVVEEKGKGNTGIGKRILFCFGFCRRTER